MTAAPAMSAAAADVASAPLTTSVVAVDATTPIEGAAAAAADAAAVPFSLTAVAEDAAIP